MRFQKTLIALAISAGTIAQSATANPFIPEAKKELGALSFHTGSPFIDDASLDVKLRFVAYDRDSYRSPVNLPAGAPPTAKAMYSSAERHDSGLAVWADFQSGWLWDAIGFDITAYGAKALANDGNPDTIQLWEENHLSSISRIGQANLKFRFGNEDTGIDGRIGRMTLNMPMASSDMDSAVPEVFEGAVVNGHYKLISGYISRFEKFGMKESSNLNKMSAEYNFDPVTGTSEYKEIPLDMAGITLGKSGEMPILSVHYGEQQDYLEKYMVTAEAGLPIGNNFVMGQFIYHTQEGGKYYGIEDYKADMFAINLLGQIGDSLMLKGGYSQVGDDPYDISFTDGVLTLVNHTAMIWNDFNQANMKTVMLGGAYSLKSIGLDDVSLISQAAYGWDADVMEMPMGGMMPLTEDHAWEGVVGFTYEVFDGPLQGLWLNATYNKDGGGYSNTQGGRVILDYTIKMF
ncbi:OprD family outer membrane porin [Parendozoicomonas haliclonae]|uniref:Outer membrane porin, OprD family n=1 Tax=Parendozoicomonas haliclonae TaxID=1960125 RepID=A0A1X7AND5_9GAMM|nr:OprD family outer membrane porin [Parendozoicomonas haliclonae]SMA49804.1 outer membrane porin, OprD family [Parendozoicomonas haliclonae]